MADGLKTSPERLRTVGGVGLRASEPLLGDRAECQLRRCDVLAALEIGERVDAPALRCRERALAGEALPDPRVRARIVDPCAIRGRAAAGLDGAIARVPSLDSDRSPVRSASSPRVSLHPLIGSSVSIHSNASMPRIIPRRGEGGSPPDLRGRRNPSNGAAPESNRPSVGLPHRTGFEDLLGHRAHAAPRLRLPAARDRGIVPKPEPVPTIARGPPAPDRARRRGRAARRGVRGGGRAGGEGLQHRPLDEPHAECSSARWSSTRRSCSGRPASRGRSGSCSRPSSRRRTSAYY